jgi:hypothetical protein
LRAVLNITQEDDELLALVSKATPAITASKTKPNGPYVADACSLAPKPASEHSRPFSIRRGDLLELRRAGERVGLLPTHALARMAYRALRVYAHRLPGFSNSSNAHLWKNFLATPAAVWYEGSEVRVALEAPQLDVIWRISGAGRTNYSLPDGRTVCVDVRK